MTTIVRTASATAALIVALATPALAGLPPLKTSDVAHAKASNTGEGGGALEPYLVTLLLPVAGIVMAVTSIGADRRLRSRHGA